MCSPNILHSVFAAAFQITSQGFYWLRRESQETAQIAVNATLRQLREEFDNSGARQWWESVRMDSPIIPTAANLIDEALGYPPLDRSDW